MLLFVSVLFRSTPGVVLSFFSSLILISALFVVPISDTNAADSLVLQPTDAEFDHFSTGFQLTGQHQFVKCETCHFDAEFQSVPTDCRGCHDGIIAVGKSVTHVQTTEECETCHNTEGFLVSAIMDHTGIVDGCVNCHNGVIATGQTVNHLPTTSTCEACHQTISWAPATQVDHNEVTPSSCFDCHNDRIALGKNVGHVNSSNVCDACHNTTSFEPVQFVDHGNVFGSCDQCHTKTNDHPDVTSECEACHGVISFIPVLAVTHSEVTPTQCIDCHAPALSVSIFAILAPGQPADHIPTGMVSCDFCHSTTAWIPATFTHDILGISDNCVLCHTIGVRATSKSVTHFATSDVCESCHRGFSVWAPLATIAIDHTQVVGTCVSCHNGVDASGKSAIHIATSDECDACHQTGPTPWVPVANSAVDHSQVLGVCSSCHDGIIATGKHAAHIVTADECDVCHSTAQWTPAAVDHSTFVGNCISCHDGVIASGKSALHIPSSNTCDACHQVFPATWLGIPASAVDHTQTIGACFDCHNGSVASGKGFTHIPTSNVCDACHQPGPIPWIPVVPAAVDHAQVTGVCFDCHNGTVASGKSAAHMTTTEVCDACHQPGPTPWIPVADSAVNHTEVLGVCSSCHNNVIALGKSGTHITTLEECDVCHSTAQWLPAAVDHSTFVGNCISCHDGIIASGVSATHIPTTTLCDACHLKFPASWLDITPAAVNHSQVVGVCFDCHNGTVASGKSATHITTTEICDACHQPGPTPWVPVAPAAVDHTQVIGVCSSCHDGTIATGKNPGHLVTTSECDICHTTGAWVPATIGTGGVPDHATIVDGCFSCHDGVIASGKSVNHINSSVACETCHQKYPATWAPVAPAAVNHTQTIGTCISCHNGTVASGKSASHITTSDTCDACHQPGPVPWIPVASAAVDHTQVIGVCSSCHNGTIATGKHAAHLVTTEECDICHTTNAWLPATIGSGGTPDHTTFVGNCINCHDGVIASGKSNNHITSSTVCDACHQKFPALWTPVAPAAVDHAQTIGTCASCHNGIIASGKSATHIASSLICDACHQPGPVPWQPVANSAVDHAQVIGACFDCHNGTIAGGKSGSHITTSNLCEACHQPAPTLWTTVPNSAVDHTQVIGVCSSCHNGTTATGKNVGHLVTTEECDLCHTTDAWTPATIGTGGTPDHTTFVGNCISCHDGVIASGKSATHILSSDVCDACHQKFPALWTPVAPAAVDHTQVIGVCSSCHNNVVATGKPANHIVTSLECDLCHTTAAWLPATTVDHTTFSGNCITCHDGNTASGKTATHISSSNVCDACHQKFPAGWAPVANAAVDHAQVFGVCFDCHNGVVASGKSGGHMSTTNICDACHRPGPIPWSPVAANAVDHNQVFGFCASCHNNVIAQGLPGGHCNTSATPQCNNCHNTTNWDNTFGDCGDAGLTPIGTPPLGPSPGTAPAPSPPPTPTTPTPGPAPTPTAPTPAPAPAPAPTPTPAPAPTPTPGPAPAPAPGGGGMGGGMGGAAVVLSTGQFNPITGNFDECNTIVSKSDPLNLIDVFSQYFNDENETKFDKYGRVVDNCDETPSKIKGKSKRNNIVPKGGNLGGIK